MLRVVHRMASAIWSPTVNTGFSDVIGSWKIIAISLPRSARSSFFGMLDEVSRPCRAPRPP